MQEIDVEHSKTSQLLASNKVLEDENRLLREQVNLLTQKLYGRQTEKMSALANLPEQGELFIIEESEEELEDDLDGSDDEDNLADPAPKPKRPRGKRLPIPAHFPRRRVIHDVSETEKQCACGACKQLVGEQTSEQIHIIPAQVEVIQDVRLKYACPVCEGTEEEGPAVVIATPPAKLLPKSIAARSLVAEIIANKFADGLPFYRQEKRFLRLGLKINRTTMANWIIKTAGLCSDLITLLENQILNENYLQADETTLRVMNEEGRLNKTLSYVWVIRGGPPDKPVVYFHYRPTRAADFIKAFLKDYQGYVQTDGYVAYDFLDHQEGVVHLGCWAHARRKFTEAIKARAKKRRTKKTHAEVGLAFIAKLYRIETYARVNQLSPQERREKRLLEAKPVIQRFKDWLDDMQPKVIPDSLLGKAIKYALGQWHRLTHYLDAGITEADNNGVENAIRPFVLGRKNWMMAASPKGAEANATLYTLVETARANGWEPFAYLSYLFEHLPLAKTHEDKYKLLPTVAQPVSTIFSGADN
jgi:transposase